MDRRTSKGTEEEGLTLERFKETVRKYQQGMTARQDALDKLYADVVARGEPSNLHVGRQLLNDIFKMTLLSEKDYFVDQKIMFSLIDMQTGLISTLYDQTRKLATTETELSHLKEEFDNKIKPVMESLDQAIKKRAQEREKEEKKQSEAVSRGLYT